MVFEEERPIDFELLAERLAALGYPARLELLKLLRFPRALGEVELRPHRLNAGDNPDRAVARQTVSLHLEKLEEAGFVRKEVAESDGRRVNRYQTNPQRFYEVVEELRRIQVLHAGADSDVTTTVDTRVRTVPRKTGPRLVLVHGLYDGKVFSLGPEAADEKGWVVGRRRGLAVSLDYDPFVSLENSLIREERGRFAIEDLDGSKNGTTVNWEILPPGLPRPMRTGDVINVGRSRLLFLQD